MSGIFRKRFNQQLYRRAPWIPSAVSANVVCTPDPASLTLTTFAPTVTATDNKTVTPSTASLTLTTFAPAIVLGTVVTPGTASLTLTTFAPSLVFGTVVTPSTTALTLTTFAPTVTVSDNKTATPSTVALTLTTFAPTVTASDHKTVTPSTAALALTTFAPTIVTPVTVTPDTAGLTLTTFAPTASITAGTTVVPSTAALTITTYAPTVDVSIDSFPVVLIGGDDAPRKKPKTKKERHDLFREMEATIHSLLHPDTLEVGAGSPAGLQTAVVVSPTVDVRVRELVDLAQGQHDLLQRAAVLQRQVDAIQARRQRELEQDEEDALLWLF